MPKKPRISKDAFDWIKDTTKEAEGKKEIEAKPEKPVKKTIPKVEKQPILKEKPAELGRIVFIRYKNNGDIVSMIEMIKGEQKPDTHPYLNVPTDETVAEFTLMGELAAKPLIDIHNNYKVDTTGKSPKLTPKAGS